jgi:hypothetical protein
MTKPLPQTDEPTGPKGNVLSKIYSLHPLVLSVGVGLFLFIAGATFATQLLLKAKRDALKYRFEKLDHLVNDIKVHLSIDDSNPDFITYKKSDALIPFLKNYIESLDLNEFFLVSLSVDGSNVRIFDHEIGISDALGKDATWLTQLSNQREAQFNEMVASLKKNNHYHFPKLILKDSNYMVSMAAPTFHVLFSRLIG